MIMAFTPVCSALGGALLGIASSGKLLCTGRILGISGAFKGLLAGDASAWRAAFLAGLAAGSAAARVLLPGAFEVLPPTFTLGRALVGGLLVGFGAAMGNGCTSGHGICGNARWSVRSLVNTLTFMATGAAAASLSGTAAAAGVATGVAPALSLPPGGTAGSEVRLYAGLLVVATATFGALVVAGRSLRRAGQAGAQPLLGLCGEAAAGAFFALGLAVSGMTRPSKVAAFLSPLLPAWDPSLMFVMGAGLLVATPVFQAVLRGWSSSFARGPACGSSFQWPAGSAVDRKLVVGGAVFGVGWGLTGMCPGPALVAVIARPAAQTVGFVASMLVGMLLESRVS